MSRLDQGLAVTAAEVLGDAAVDKELRTVLRGLPVMIRVNGLAMTCAFLLARAKNQDNQYRKAAVALLDNAAAITGVPVGPKPTDTLTALARLDGSQYLLAEFHGRMLAGWLSRLGDARYTPPAGDLEAAG